MRKSDKIILRPVVKKIEGYVTDLLPVRLALGDLEATCLMEREGRSHLFLSPQYRLTIRDGKFSVIADGKEEVFPGNPLKNLKAYLENFGVEDPNLPAFCAGAVGYLGYDCVQYLEKVPLPPEPAIEDEACFYVFGEAIICDYANNVTYLSALDERAIARLEKSLEGRAPASRPVNGEAAYDVDSTTFTRGVKAIKEHILNGDIFQCVLSQQMEYPSQENPLHIYRRLRETSHSPYRYYFQSPTQAVVGASPEMLVRVTGDLVESCPIAGTRKRGKTPAEDKNLERQLLRSPKEKAEHLMLVDLSRNDLGRVCQPGTVRVKDFMQVQRFSHVMHLVSLVQGKLLKKHSALDALFAAFPAGTLTGAPKIRAMEIISRLETKRRGAYGGAVVMLDFAGNLDSCITIRTLIATKNRVSVRAGAGIVADSTAKRELHEIEVKSLAARLALGAKTV